MKKALWVKLRNYHFDDIVPPQLTDRVSALFGGTDPSTKAFASKLSRKLGWSPRFAMRAIDEYKRFVFLGTATGITVTPSKVIDQVWHEHLLFSRAYRSFCFDVLGRDFDHNPELVPADDQLGVFETQYLLTLEAYRTEFNAEPPAEIWGTPKFKTELPLVSANTTRTRPTGAQDSWSSDTPLHFFFDGGSSSDSGHGSHDFGGGGGFDGGGASRDWGGHSDGHSHGGDQADSGSSDSGSSDSGSSCSSSCSSGCSSSD